MTVKAKNGNEKPPTTVFLKNLTAAERVKFFTFPNITNFVSDISVQAQNKEGILPVATLSIAIYVSNKARSRRDVPRGVKCCRRRWQPQLIASTSKSHRASNALQQDKFFIL